MASGRPATRELAVSGTTSQGWPRRADLPGLHVASLLAGPLGTLPDPGTELCQPPPRPGLRLSSRRRLRKLLARPWHHVGWEAAWL